jgi:hypothetical protein
MLLRPPPPPPRQHKKATHPTPPAHVPVQVKYKNVMQQYNLGPNGGILTSCNLFATRFDQV